MNCNREIGVVFGLKCGVVDDAATDDDETRLDVVVDVVDDDDDDEPPTAFNSGSIVGDVDIRTIRCCCCCVCW